MLVGHFGTFGGHIATLVEAVLPLVLAGDKNRFCLLLGRGSDPIRETTPDAQVGRKVLFASGSLPELELAAYLATCDLLIQPYVDRCHDATWKHDGRA